MTTEQLAEIEARAAKASGGKWTAVSDTFADADEAAAGVAVAMRRGGPTVHTIIIGKTESQARTDARAAGKDNDAGTLFAATTGNGPTAGANAAFIAHARDDIPALCAEVRRLRALLDRTEPCVEACLSMFRREGLWGEGAVLLLAQDIRAALRGTP